MRVEGGVFITPAHLLSPGLGGQIINPLNSPIKGGAQTRDDALFEFPSHDRDTRLRGRLSLNMAPEGFFIYLIRFTLPGFTAPGFSVLAYAVPGSTLPGYIA